MYLVWHFGIWRARSFLERRTFYGDRLTRTRAQKLRNNATKEENHLWYDFLKDYPVQFRRQVPFSKYILDFYCAKANLAIELDGAQHYMEDGLEYDSIRAEYLKKHYEIQILRFSNLDIKENFEGVCTAIEIAVKKASPLRGEAVERSETDEGEFLRIKRSKDVGTPHPTSLRSATFPPAGGRLYSSQENPMKTVTIYTDGACSGNPGPGGWGAILMYGEHKKELSGGEKQTTNNRMELTGVIEALKALKEPCVVELYSDSKYVIDALEKGWARGWKARGWIKGDKKPALNPDLWEILLGLCDYHKVNLHWVKGHASNPYNNRCDELAVAQSQKFK